MEIFEQSADPLRGSGGLPGRPPVGIGEVEELVVAEPDRPRDAEHQIELRLHDSAEEPIDGAVLELQAALHLPVRDAEHAQQSAQNVEKTLDLFFVRVHAAKSTLLFPRAQCCY